MSTEAYTVNFEKSKYHAPVIDEKNRDTILFNREKEIQENILRYVGEYRLGVKFDEFYYNQEEDHLGNTYLGTIEGPIGDVFRKSISERLEKGLSVKREVAECLGFDKFEKEMLERPTGSMAVWVSPPGSIEDGYGGYSFTFLAQSESDENGKKIRVIPYRNEFTIQQHNSYLSQLLGHEVSYEMDSQFLSQPFFLEKTDRIQKPEDILNIIGETEEFDNSWYEDFTKKAWPLIQGFVYLVKTNASDESLIKARNAIENFAIAYREDKNTAVKSLNISDSDWRQYDSMVTIHGYLNDWGKFEPPTVKGSCGPSGENQKPANKLSDFQKEFGGLTKDKYGERTFNCPSCNKENVRPYNKLLKRCQHCNSSDVAC